MIVWPSDVLGVLHHDLGAADRDVLDLVGARPEDDAAEQRRQRVVEVDVRVVDADQRVHRALDQVLARLGQHRDRDVLGHPVLLDQLADEREVGLARAREADLDLLVAHLHEQLEHPQLAGRAHRVDQRLVAVAQVGGEPARRLGDLPGRPGAVGQVDRLERAIAPERHRAGLLGVGEAGVLESHGPVLLASGRVPARTRSLRSEEVRLVQTSLRQRRRRLRVMTGSR